MYVYVFHSFYNTKNLSSILRMAKHPFLICKILPKHPIHYYTTYVKENTSNLPK